MIHFLIDGWSKHICQDLIWSCYEIGLRLGTPFLIDSVGAEIAADQVVVGYRGPAAVGGVESNRYLSLPVALSDPVEEMPCGHREVSGRSLWIPRETSEPDVISGVLHLLRFFHESQIGDHERDDLSRIPPTRHPLAQAGFFIEPLLDNNVEYLRARLSQWGMDIPPPCPWGKRGEYAVCLTHDVDGPRLHTLFALARSAIYALRGDRFERESAELGLLSWLMRRPDPYWNFAHWQSLEHGLGIASTYFFHPGRVPGIRRHPRDPRYETGSPPFTRVLLELRGSGCEIGLHNPINGHSLAAYQSAKEKLEKCSAGEVSGCRGHYWAINWKDPLASWRGMQQAGFSYDASMSPMALGLRQGTLFPTTPSGHWQALDNGDRFTVFPTAVMDSYTVPRAAGTDHHFIDQAMDRLLKSVIQRRGILVLDWHVRALSNVGAWQGYLVPLLKMLKTLMEDSQCRFLTLEQARTHWSRYAKDLCVGIMA